MQEEEFDRGPEQEPVIKKEKNWRKTVRNYASRVEITHSSGTTGFRKGTEKRPFLQRNSNGRRWTL